MRLFFAFSAALLISELAFGQAPISRGYVVPGCCGPYVPLVTTPMISLQSVSPNPVGATNATYGLVAGAANSTLSIINTNISSSYTQPVWYQGGTTPLMSEPAVEVSAHPMRMDGMERREHMEAEYEHGREAARTWTYYAAAEQTASAVEAAAAAKTARHASRTITNQDIDQENQKTGTVKYDGKTEQLK